MGRFQVADGRKSASVLNEFDVSGSVHLGNICFYLIPTGCTICFISFLKNFKLYMFRCYLHPSSGAQLQCTAIGFYGFVCFIP
jgi:hypothetical protein